MSAFLFEGGKMNTLTEITLILMKKQAELIEKSVNQCHDVRLLSETLRRISSLRKVITQNCEVLKKAGK